jgi:hypothetical protein
MRNRGEAAAEYGLPGKPSHVVVGALIFSSHDRTVTIGS